MTGLTDEQRVDIVRYRLENALNTLSSLKKFRKKFDKQLATPYIVHYQDYKEDDGIVYLPIYMVSLL